MPAYLSPVGNEQQSDANGNPLSGGSITTFAAGTSTQITTYTESTGTTSQTNPIVLNASGLPANPLWLPAGQAVKLVIKDSGGVTLRTLDNVQGINDPAYTTSQTEWTPYTGTVTYITATSFSVAGDQTGIFQVNRRVKTTNTGGTRYSTVTASSYSAGSGLTTITVVNDSGSLDTGLSAVAYGLLAALNPSIPKIPLNLGTTVASTSGTAIDFTGIPAWVRRITVNLAAVSTNGTANYLLRLGTSSGIEAAGYACSDLTSAGASPVVTNFTTGIGVAVASAGAVVSGRMVFELTNAATNLWTATGAFGRSDATVFHTSAGSKSLAGTLDRLRLTAANGTDTFDAGSVNILFE